MKLQYNMQKNIKITEDVNRKAIISKMLYAKMERNVQKKYLEKLVMGSVIKTQKS